MSRLETAGTRSPTSVSPTGAHDRWRGVCTTCDGHVGDGKCLFFFKSLERKLTYSSELSDVYRVRAGAVSVKVFTVVEFPIASMLPTAQETVDMLRILPPELAKGVSEQDLWDWKTHDCKPEVRMEIYVAHGDGSVVAASVGIEYPAIIQRN